MDIPRKSKLTHTVGLARKWLPPITLEDKSTVIDAFNGSETSFGTPLLRKYIELLLPYTKILGIGRNGGPREPDCLASGIVFFLWMFMLYNALPRLGEAYRGYLPL